MSSTTGPAHRSVSNIRSQPTANSASPSSPRTPLRTISSTYGSPSSLRAEEDCVVVELGSRYLRAGFAGDAVPKAVIDFGPDEQRRPGDYRRWGADYEKDWRKRMQGKGWGESYELWNHDLRGADLGLVGDKIERALREAFNRYLLIDSRPRRIALVLDSALPLPLLSAILTSLFNNFQPPNISLLSAPVLTTVAAGLRSALVVDIGWAETVATSIYEFREVQCKRSTRASKILNEEMLKMLADAIGPVMEGASGPNESLEDIREILSFEECEDIIIRMASCKPAKVKPKESSQVLESVEEEDELRSSMRSMTLSGLTEEDLIVSIPLSSTNTPRTLRIPFSKLAEPCEAAIFASSRLTQDFDDEELPLHLLVYRSLLQLPVDVRTMCMSRIVFVGGGSMLLGLKERVLDEVNRLVEQFGWDPVRGKAVDQVRNNPRLGSRQSSDGPTEVQEASDDPLAPRIIAALVKQEHDPIEEQIKREASKGAKPVEMGYLRTVDSLGAWSGGSLLQQLKVPAVSIVDREQWQAHGVAGASREVEVNVNVTAKRQSMGAAAFKAGAVERQSWTLGLWG